MKKSLFTLVALSTFIVPTFAVSEMYVELKNGKTDTFDVSKVSEVYFSSEEQVMDEIDSPLKFELLKVDYSKPPICAVKGVKAMPNDSSIVVPARIRIDGTVYDVVNISNIAFDGINNLKNVIFPESIIYLGHSAFAHCKNLETVNIPRDVKYINSETFLNCYKLKEIVLHESIIEIEYRAFAYCKDLVNVEFPSSLNKIGYKAFYGCDSFTKVDISSNINSIGYGAFASCSNLMEINVSPDNENYSSENGVLYNKDKTEIVGVVGSMEGEFTIESNVTSLMKSAFDGCGKLTNVIIPESITSIPEYCFNSCTGLTNIEMPESISEIGDYAFSGCSSLTSVKIPLGVTTIGKYAFWQDKKLTTVKIPSSVTYINSYAFRGCENLEVIIDNTEGAVSISSGALDDCKSVVYLK